jgi:xylan 1,4-beta-xylosidase
VFTKSHRGFRVSAALLFATLAMATMGAGAQSSSTLVNPIIPGDHPDPTIIRVGTTYWTTSTSGNWAPQFPLSRSTDLLHWIAAGAIFPHTPAWARGDFWAPELVSDGGRTLVYYVARKREGPLCVAVATAATPGGPYEDHGPILCQDDGSIDPAFIRDEHGRPFLVWKEDGNSRNQPTVLWAQPLTPDLVRLTGDKTQLLVNDPSSWEGGVIEAPYILKHDGAFYMFYAGNACCGVQCRYAEGVAKATHLLGPWNRDPGNPIIAANDVWRCPGHGTAVANATGQDYFLYHAYPTQGTVYLGRESVLDPITWSATGWPVVNGGHGPGEHQASTSLNVVDHFPGSALSSQWRWPVGHEPLAHVASGTLTLTIPQEATQSLIAQSLVTATYQATVNVLPSATSAGLALIGDAQDSIALLRRGSSIELVQADHTGTHTLWHQNVTAVGQLSVRVISTQKGEALFSFRTNNTSESWTPAGASIGLDSILPWDSGLRIGLVVDGVPGKTAAFTSFSMRAAEQ